MMRITSLLLLALGLLCLGAISAEASPHQQSTDPRRQLRDIPVLVDQRHGQWIGAGNGLSVQSEDVCQNPYIPLDGEFQGQPAYHIAVTGGGDGGWWNALLAGNDWESYSIVPYQANGALEFNIRGAIGGEDMKVAVKDIDFERTEKNTTSNEVRVSSYVTVSPEWQSVKIPIVDLIPSSGAFKLNQIYGITLVGVESKAVDLWINNLRWTSPDLEPAFPAIKINQLGYTLAAEKYAYVSGFEDDMTARAGTPFEVREIGNNIIVHSGELELVSALDAGASGELVLRADFSPISVAGDYYLAVSAYRVDDSAPFVIRDGLYSELLNDATRYFYLQRQGMALDASYAGIFARGNGHPQDATAQLRSNEGTVLDVSQGWYDAGDYGKYVNAGAIALSDLLWSYELFPDQFVDNQFNIPEGNNGVPDLLDEMRWELDFILKMQDATSGGFYHMVQPSENFVPDEATGIRYIEDVRVVSTVSADVDPVAAIVGCGETIIDGQDVKPTSTSASAVAALAHAAIVFADVDAEYAQKLLDSAEFGWQYLNNNPTGIAPVDGPYADKDDTDDRFWAAGALWRATGNEQYHEYIRNTYKEMRTDFLATDENSYGLDKTGMIGVWHYFSAENNDPEIHDWLAGQFDLWRTAMVSRSTNSVWQTTLLDEDYYWGSNYVALTTPLALAVGTKALGTYDSDITQLSQTALNYLLGINPLRISYISGYGEDSVQHLHSQIWSLDGIPEIPRGILAGGPNAYSDPLFYSNFPAKRYLDNPVTWTVNEHTIYWNAALVFNAALVSAEAAQQPDPIVVQVATAEVLVAPVEAPPLPTATPAPTLPTTAPVPIEPQPVQSLATPLQAALIIGGITLFTIISVAGLVWVYFIRR